jgi:hypothetical protein
MPDASNCMIYVRYVFMAWLLIGSGGYEKCSDIPKEEMV